MSFNRDKISATILGGAVGDALGGIAERASLNLSDDTQLTLATCEAIVARRRVTPEAIAESMLEWFVAGRITGIGSSTLKALRDLEAGAHWALSGARGEYAAGNGAAMRAAPLAFCLDPARREHRVLIRDICRITHHSDEAYVGALAVVIAVRSAALRENWTPEEVASSLPDSRVRDNLVASAGMADESLETVARSIGSSGFVAETVPVALKLAHAIVERGFERAIHEMNEIGGDTDTIAAIAGQIAAVQNLARYLNTFSRAFRARSRCLASPRRLLPLPRTAQLIRGGGRIGASVRRGAGRPRPERGADVKATTPPMIALSTMFLLGNLGAAFEALGGSGRSGFMTLHYVGVAWAFSWWVLNDSSARGVPTSIDHGWFVFIAWPLVVPYHLLRTRGARGLLLLGGIAAMFVASHVAGLVLFALLS